MVWLVVHLFIIRVSLNTYVPIMLLMSWSFLLSNFLPREYPSSPGSIQRGQKNRSYFTLVTSWKHQGTITLPGICQLLLMLSKNCTSHCTLKICCPSHCTLVSHRLLWSWIAVEVFCLLQACPLSAHGGRGENFRAGIQGYSVPVENDSS